MAGALCRFARNVSKPNALALGRLASQVGQGPESVIKAVREIGRANYQRQLDDLPLIEEFSQLRKGTVPDCRSTSRNAFGIQNYGLVFLIEQRAALVE